MPLEQFFDTRMWTPIMSQVCITCHSQAKNPYLMMTQGGATANLAATVKEAKAPGPGGKSMLLFKPSSTDMHTGGQLVLPNSAPYKDFDAFVKAVQSGADCVPAAGP